VLLFKRVNKRANEYPYTDPKSRVTIKQLLALSWCAIHDNDLREGTLDDAKQLFCEGLYEVQREYNISLDTEVDTGGLDTITCAGGEFNKIMEKLVTIHPDVRIDMVTHQIAGLKFKVVVKKAVQEYFAANANPQTADEFVQFTQDIKQFNTDGVEAIWPAIKNEITTRMFDEFGSLYIHANDPMFTGVIDSGIYVLIPPGFLPSFQKDLSESKGYHQFCKNIIQNKAIGFFKNNEADYLLENIHISPELQDEYDKQYGLVLR
jgi:hypothetical protein